jgi:hypothetical protein
MRIKNVFSFISASLMLILLNCDPHVPRKMLINDSENIVINFGNNKIEITAVNWGGYILNYRHSIFYLYMYYNLARDITIHRDAIHIEYYGKTIEWVQLINVNSNRKRTSSRNMDFNDIIKSMNEQIIWDPEYKLSGNGHLSLPFTLVDDIEVKKGDKITITAPDFITYDGDTVSLGELTLEIGKFYR